MRIRETVEADCRTDKRLELRKRGAAHRDRGVVLPAVADYGEIVPARVGAARFDVAQFARQVRTVEVASPAHDFGRASVSRPGRVSMAEDFQTAEFGPDAALILPHDATVDPDDVSGLRLRRARLERAGYVHADAALLQKKMAEPSVVQENVGHRPSDAESGRVAESVRFDRFGQFAERHHGREKDYCKKHALIIP